MRQFLAACLIGFAALFSPLGADGARADDRAAIRSVIESQIEAFRADDDARAYGYAAPGIRRMFPSPERFMRMVREGYRPVYRPRDVTFGALRESPLGPIQEVFLVDEAGIAWTALYSLEQQPDGSWLISGCRLVRTGLSA